MIWENRCRKCNSLNVLRCKWVNPNTMEVSSMDAGLDGLIEWCEDCKAETTIVEVPNGR